MNWNETIQQLAETHWNPKNRVVAAKEGLSVLIGLDERIQSAAKNLRKPIPGFRYFHCDECNRRFWHKTRDCLSPSNETCPECFADVSPHDREEHPEWLIDKSGNLV